jgi:hypothetical protein
MKLKKIIKLFGVFSFAFSAAVGAIELRDDKQFDDLGYWPTNSKDFLTKIHDDAKNIEKHLSQKDQELIDSIEKDPEAAGFSQQSKNEGVFDVLKNIATLRIIITLQKSREEEKKKDVQNLIKVYKMIEDYRDPELPTLKDQSDELQKKVRKDTYKNKISMDKLKINTKWTNENHTLKYEVIGKKAEEIAEKIQEMNEKPELVVYSETAYFHHIVNNMKELEKDIQNYNKEPDAWSPPSYAPLPPIFISSKIPLNKPVAKKKRRPKKKLKNKRLRKLKKIKK